MVRVVFLAVIALGISSGSGLAQENKFKESSKEAVVYCTVDGGDPYSITVEHGACDLGEHQVGGSGDGGGGGVTRAQCINTFMVAQRQCRGNEACYDRAAAAEKACFARAR